MATGFAREMERTEVVKPSLVRRDSIEWNQVERLFKESVSSVVIQEIKLNKNRQ